MLETFWIPFVRARELGLSFPGAEETYWLFDEFLRRATLLYLGEARPINIEIPEGNDPNYPSG